MEGGECVRDVLRGVVESAGIIEECGASGSSFKPGAKGGKNRARVWRQFEIWSESI